jgi:hypothetical protein
MVHLEVLRLKNQLCLSWNHVLSPSAGGRH